MTPPYYAETLFFTKDGPGVMQVPRPYKRVIEIPHLVSPPQAVRNGWVAKAAQAFKVRWRSFRLEHYLIPVEIDGTWHSPWVGPYGVSWSFKRDAVTLLPAVDPSWKLYAYPVVHQTPDGYYVVIPAYVEEK